MRSSSPGPTLRISKFRSNHVRMPDTIQYTDQRQIETSAQVRKNLVRAVASVGFCEKRGLTGGVVGAEATESNADEWSMVCSLSSATSSIFSPSLSIVQRITRGSFRRSVCKPLSVFGDASKCMNQ